MKLLDPREEHFRIPGPWEGLQLFLRYLSPSSALADKGIVLYVHGATFPSALSIAHRFDGWSWRDQLCAAGFHVWGFDFQGFEWDRFIEDVPGNHPPVLSRRHFDEWADLYLDSDGESRSRHPASVKVPSGPAQDIAAAWHSELAYDPGSVKAPVAIVRGEWDHLANDLDAASLFSALSSSPIKRDIKISHGTHLMHLEESRFALYREAVNFLLGGDDSDHASRFQFK